MSLQVATETDVLREEVTDESAWTAADLERSTDWLIEVTPKEVQAISAAVSAAKELGSDWSEVSVRDAWMPELGQLMNRVMAGTTGRGIVVLRGLPLGEGSLGEDDARIAHWILGKYLGTVVPQNMFGELLGHVIAMRSDDDPNLRPYDRAGAQPFHPDRSDVVALLCLRNAKTGGESLVLSSRTVHNTILKERPDLLEPLYRTYYHDLMGEELKGESPYFPSPIYANVDGYLSCRAGRDRIRNSQRFAEVPRLKPDEEEAMEYMVDVCGRLAYKYLAKPGDIQYLSNYHVLHSRTDYVDYPEINRRRYMSRMWLKLDHEFPLTPEFEDKRDGIPLNEGISPSAPLEPRIE